jgi:hypothetical protein
MKYSVAVDRDVNRTAFGGNFPCTVKRTITFLGGTTDAWGDNGGALDDTALFTVTGLVIARVMAVCKTDLASSNGTLTVGIAGAVSIFLPVETATQIDADQIWVNDAANSTYIIAGEEQAAADNLPEYLLYGNDILLEIGTGDITGGVLDFYCQYRPISSDAKIVPTTT